jgi:hypothetical protein
MLTVIPVSLKEANAFVLSFHRHNKPVAGARWAIGLSDGVNLVGVAIVGRPVARGLQDGVTSEVVRCCVREGVPNGCSALYGACWRAWRAMGGRRLVTYTLQRESGASLRGAGFKVIGELPARDAAGWANRPGREWQSVVGEAKLRWERVSRETGL